MRALGSGSAEIGSADIHRSSELFAGRYELIRELGRGGEGCVILARDRRDGRDVAIKVRTLTPEPGCLVGESRVLRTVPEHPHLPRVRDESAGDGLYLVVMDWIDGPDLSQLLRDEGRPGLSLELVSAYVRDLASALDHLHAHGVMHLDVKPANAVLRRDGTVVLVDVGTAWPISHGGDPRRGTNAYLAPELVAGQHPTAMSDVFGLAVTAFVLLTGSLPSPGDPPSWRGVPEPVAARLLEVFTASLAIDPRRRPRSAGAFATLLRSSLAIDLPTPTKLSGRDRELRELLERLEASRHTFTACVISGSAGMGKTRLCQELAKHAIDRGSHVMWARCGSTPVGSAWAPWAELLSRWARSTRASVVAETLGEHRPLLGQLVPELADPDAGVQRENSLPMDYSRHEVFDAVRTVLGRVARTAPIAIVVDDLHSSDLASLELFRFIAAEPPDAPILLIGTYRDGQMSNGALVEQDLGGNEPGALMNLEGLTHRGVGELVGDLIGRRLPDETVSLIHTLTAGNPLFAGEVTRLVMTQATFDAASIVVAAPGEVRMTIRKRIGALPMSVRATLRCASVIGQRFEADIVADALGLPRDEALRHLEEARCVGLVTEGEPASYVFAHPLLREVTYDDLHIDDRRELHGRVGEAIKSSCGADSDVRLPELAHHFGHAALSGDGIELVVSYAMRAADRAVGVAAYEQAVDHLTLASRILGEAEHEFAELRCEVLVCLGEAMVSAGSPDVEHILAAATDLAKQLRRGDLLARIVMSQVVEFARVDAERIGLAEHALRLLPASDHTMRARMLAYLGLMLSYTRERDRGIAMCEEAVRMGRQLGDQSILHDMVAHRLFARYGPDNLDERLHPPAELADVEGRRLPSAGFIWQIRMAALSESGDLAAADVEIARAERILQRFPDPYWRWSLQLTHATRALVEGHFDVAESLITDAWKLGERVGAPDAFSNFAAQLAILRREQGRADELIGVVRDFAAKYPDVSVWRIGLAVFLAESGATDEARAELERLATQGFQSLPKDWSWLFATSVLCELCYLLDDATSARRLVDMLSPYRDRFATITGNVPAGPVSYFLALGNIVGGDIEAAAACAQDAMSRCRLIGARPWLARSLIAAAIALKFRGKRDDVERAEALLEEAVTIAEHLGMSRVFSWAQRLAADRPSAALQTQRDI